MLKKTCLLTACLLLLAGSSSADFLQDFQAAAGKKKSHDYSEAAAAYVKLGKAQKDAKLADICYLHAAEALASGKKLEDALETAKAIQDPAVREYARMLSYHASGRLRQLKEVFKDTDIASWPDEYAYLGYFMRGNALQGADGLYDLEQALACCGSDFLTRDAIRRTLAERYILLKDNQKAHAVLDELIATAVAKGGVAYLVGVRSKAVLLAQEKKFAEADRTLALIDRKWDRKEGLQYFWFLITKAKIEAEKGHQSEAEKLYDEAFAMKEIPANIIRFQKIDAAVKFPKYKEMV